MKISLLLSAALSVSGLVSAGIGGSKQRHRQTSEASPSESPDFVNPPGSSSPLSEPEVDPCVEMGLVGLSESQVQKQLLHAIKTDHFDALDCLVTLYPVFGRAHRLIQTYLPPKISSGRVLNLDGDQWVDMAKEKVGKSFVHVQVYQGMLDQVEQQRGEQVSDPEDEDDIPDGEDFEQAAREDEDDDADDEEPPTRRSTPASSLQSSESGQITDAEFMERLDRLVATHKKQFDFNEYMASCHLLYLATKAPVKKRVHTYVSVTRVFGPKFSECLDLVAGHRDLYTSVYALLAEHTKLSGLSTSVASGWVQLTDVIGIENMLELTQGHQPQSTRRRFGRGRHHQKKPSHETRMLAELLMDAGETEHLTVMVSRFKLDRKFTDYLVEAHRDVPEHLLSGLMTNPKMFKTVRRRVDLDDDQKAMLRQNYVVGMHKKQVRKLIDHAYPWYHWRRWMTLGKKEKSKKTPVAETVQERSVQREDFDEGLTQATII